MGNLGLCVYINKCSDLNPDKIIIFSSTFSFSEPGVDLTDYVATRWYRAPELLVRHVQTKQNNNI